jgi:plasmid maintenance system antidote protein VapI
MTWNERQQAILRALMEQTGYNLSKLASVLEVARPHLSNALNGKRGMVRGFDIMLSKFQFTSEMQIMVRKAMVKPFKTRKRR